MDPQFWKSGWAEGRTAFHQADGNPTLVKILSKETKLQSCSDVFVPLCGKTRDLLHFKNSGMNVIGVELSEIAVEEFFKENDLDYHVETRGQHKVYESENLKIYCGDLFSLPLEELNFVDFVYDRACYVALPTEMRERYSSFMKRLKAKFPECSYLLLTIEYDPSFKGRETIGPPFSISPREVDLGLGKTFGLRLVEEAQRSELPGRASEAGIPFLTHRVYANFHA